MAEVAPKEGEWILRPAKTNWIATLSNKNYWAFYFLVIVAICVGGIGYFGEVAHYEVPPLCDFVGPDGNVVISGKSINHGEEVFHLRGLMAYGSFLGDGSERGPDYTAEALHEMAIGMTKHYESKLAHKTQHDIEALKPRIRSELRNNAYDKEKDVVVINSAQIAAWKRIKNYYRSIFSGAEQGAATLTPNMWITDPTDINDLAAFFFWGAWISVAARPGEDYSYTHNWPHEPLAGNIHTPVVILWSAISVLVLWFGLDATLFVYGQLDHEDDDEEDIKTKGQPLTTQDLETGVVREIQVECYKFFVLSMLAFAIQVLAGVCCAIEFVRPLDFTACYLLGYNVLRSFHATFQIFWFFVAWTGTTIWFLPRFQRRVPYGQKFLINVLFIGCCIVAVGGAVGIPLGQTSYLQGEMAYYFGSQGWEFMELGRIFQDLLLCGFVLWILILFRGMYSYITWNYSYCLFCKYLFYRYTRKFLLNTFIYYYGYFTCVICNKLLYCNWNIHVLNGSRILIQFDIKTYEKGCFKTYEKGCFLLYKFYDVIH